MSAELRVALRALGNDRWTGGITYQQNLLEAVRQYAPQVEMCVLTQSRSNGLEKDDYHIVKSYPLPEYSRSLRLMNRIVCRLFGYDLLLSRALQAIPGGVDLIFPAQFSVGKRTATLYWIPDFQHVHLPEMFAADDIRVRDIRFRRGIKRATLVVVSSRDTQKDLCQFAPDHAHKARVMSFVAYVPIWVYDTNPRSVLIHHNLPERFFYLPNQFWKHKNHIIVLEALKILGERGVRPFVACTGNPRDYRSPTHFAELLQKISLWDLHDSISLLGFVSREQVYLLIRQSICVINPSLFEGWSTAVEEAKSVGKRVLLSDLAVHREQNPAVATYFDPHSPEDLADRMEELWDAGKPGPDLELEQRARSELRFRMQEYAATFVSIAHEAVAIARGNKNARNTV